MRNAKFVTTTNGGLPRFLQYFTDECNKRDVYSFGINEVKITDISVYLEVERTFEDKTYVLKEDERKEASTQIRLALEYVLSSTLGVDTSKLTIADTGQGNTFNILAY